MMISLTHYAIVLLKMLQNKKGLTMVNLCDKTVLAFDDKDMLKVYKLLAEYNVDYDEVGSYVVSYCPNCGDSEFWDGGHCNHCGYNL